ncbi:unnamed protein product [Hyaloperonospora brassicae]|uniref:RxLR effector candidate protein n=1 Tax=Hyaloperonospora brassicae TaxID=162125 RepID=A0AAV0TEK0_HYABA|nr:unnamed protein product [Hyaloperonospora brassicae]
MRLFGAKLAIAYMATLALATAGSTAGQVATSGAHCDDPEAEPTAADLLALGFAPDNKGVVRKMGTPDRSMRDSRRPACIEVGLWCPSIGKTLAADPENDCKFPPCPQ